MKADRSPQPARSVRLKAVLILGLSATLGLSACADPASALNGPAAAKPTATPVASDPTPSSAPVSSPTQTPTPFTDPALDAAAQALDEQGRGPYAGTYDNVAIESETSSVTLYITDTEQGRKLIAAARAAHPAITKTTVNIVLARFTKKALDTQMDKVAKLMNHRNPEIYTVAANVDGSGLTVTTAKKNVPTVKSQLDKLVTTPTGIPVTVQAGSPPAW